MTAWAQRPVYTLNQYTPQLINPAFATYNYKADFSFFHDEVTVAGGEYFNTNSINADYVFVNKETGRKLIGIGINVLGQDSGESDLLKTQQAGLSIATPIQVAKGQFIHFGINATYVNMKTSLEQLSTGSQWIAAEFRYDPTASLGESFVVQQVDYISLSAGALWSWEKDGHQKARAGISLWDANSPDVSFFEDPSDLPMTFQVHGEAVIYDKRQVQLTPSFYYQRFGQLNSYTALFSTKLFFVNDNPYDIISSGNLDLIAQYSFNSDASIAVVFNQPKFSMGFSYHFPLGKEDQYLQNGLQIGMTVSKVLWKPKVKRVKIDAVSSTRRFDFDQNSEVTYQKSEVDQMKSQLEELDHVKAYQFELTKDFQFSEGNATLTSESQPFLDEVIQLLEENPAWTLQIIGHTDNVGKKQDNYELSVRRAQAVADYLVEQGFSVDQLIVSGRGDTEPLSKEDSDAAKAQNRRVQFLINVVND